MLISHLLVDQLGLDVLVNDLGVVHTLSKHNRDALLNGSQHV